MSRMNPTAAEIETNRRAARALVVRQRVGRSVRPDYAIAHFDHVLRQRAAQIAESEIHEFPEIPCLWCALAASIIAAREGAA
jgi:hypothetical protein